MAQRIEVDRWYTVDEAARILGVKPPAVRRWLKGKGGTLKGKKMPYGQGQRKRWMIKGVEVNRAWRELHPLSPGL